MENLLQTKSYTTTHFINRRQLKIKIRRRRRINCISSENYQRTTQYKQQSAGHLKSSIQFILHTHTHMYNI